MLKSGILDNAGKAITRALITLGYINVENVRIGKTIYINETTEKQIKLIAKALRITAFRINNARGITKILKK